MTANNKGQKIVNGCMSIVGVVIFLGLLIGVVGGGYYFYDTTWGPTAQKTAEIEERAKELADRNDALCNGGDAVPNRKGKGPLAIGIEKSSPYYNYFSSIEGVGEPPAVIICVMERTSYDEPCTYFGIGDIPLERNDALFWLIDVASGDLIASQEFSGPASCPLEVPVGSSVVPAFGYVDKETVLAWLNDSWSP